MRAGLAALGVLCGLAACSGGSDTAPVAKTAPAASTAADCTATAAGRSKSGPGSRVRFRDARAGHGDHEGGSRQDGLHSRPGRPLILTGTVFADCTTPAPGAVINVWQTDARGRYGPPDENGDPRCCYLRGRSRPTRTAASPSRRCGPAIIGEEGLRPGAHPHGGPLRRWRRPDRGVLRPTIPTSKASPKARSSSSATSRAPSPGASTSSSPRPSRSCRIGRGD